MADNNSSGSGSGFRITPLTAGTAEQLYRAVTWLCRQIQNFVGRPQAPGGSLKPEEVGFFNPSLKDPERTGIVAQGKNAVYTDVFAFTDRLVHLAEIHGDDKVNQVGTEQSSIRNTTTSVHFEVLEPGGLRPLKDVSSTYSEALKTIMSKLETMDSLVEAAEKAKRGFRGSEKGERLIFMIRACNLPGIVFGRTKSTSGIFKTAHDTGAHLGIIKTYTFLKSIIFMPSLKQHVQTYAGQRSPRTKSRLGKYGRCPRLRRPYECYIFSPCNGLFLHTTIERALDKGWLVIVPDVDLEPSNPARPLDDLTDRQERLKSWEKQDVESILENAINEGSELEPSLQGLAVVADDVIVKTRAPQGIDDEEDDGGSDDDVTKNVGPLLVV
ncbi:hypothetical protein AAE478_001175 [Parahypoxylon ruwenzoriense]